MCGDTICTVGKLGLSDLAFRLVPDEAVPRHAREYSRTVPKVTHCCPDPVCRVCVMVLSPAG